MLGSTRSSLALLAAFCLAPVAAEAGGPELPPVGWSQGNVLLDGDRMHYWRTGGDKPPLLLLHGYSDDGLCWTEIASSLQGDYDVIMTDARGHGLSDPPAADDSADAQVEDIAGVIKALGLEKPIVMGHSMGSASAAWFAAKYPDVPRGVVLVDPRLVPRDRGGRSDDDDEDPEVRLKKETDWILSRNNRSYEDLLAECLDNEPGWSRTECEYWARSKQLYHPGLARRNRGDRPSMKELCERITAPTLILKADAPAQEQAANQKVADILAAGTLVHVPNAGHSIQRDEPARFLKEVNAFFDTLDD